MPITAQQIVNGASWVAMGTTTAAAFDARYDKDGTLWIFQQLGNGWAHYRSNLTLIAEGNFFSNTTSQQVVQHDEGIMLWGQDDASHYFVCDTSHLYKLDSSMATVATLALNTLTPNGTIDGVETYNWEDLICFKSGSTNYIAIVSTITISPDVFISGIIWIINADTMAFVGSYASRPTTRNHYGWKAWGDKNGDIWCFVENDDTQGADLIRWHPADGVTGTTLNATLTSVSSATIGSQFPFAFSEYNPTNHSVILYAYGNATTNNSVLSEIDLTSFTQLTYRGDDGLVGYQGHADGSMSATELTALYTLAALGDANPEGNYPGGVLQLLDPATLAITNTFDIAAVINAAAVGTLWQGKLDPFGPAYAGAWLFDPLGGRLLAGFSNLGISSAVYLISGLPTFASPALSASPTTMTFSAQEDGSAPASQSASMTNSGSGSVLDWSASTNHTWLSVSPTSGSTPDSASISVDPTALGTGTYTGTVTFISGGLTATVDVTFNVVNPEALWNVSFSEDQFAQLTWNGLSAGTLSLFLRRQGGNGFQVGFTSGSDAGFVVDMTGVYARSFNMSGVLAAADVIKVTAVGRVISIYRNGTLEVTLVAPSSIPTGNSDSTGLTGFAVSLGSSVDDWSSGTVTPGGGASILQRDLSVNSDNGTAYLANAVFGSYEVVQPGQVAAIVFVATDSVAVGTMPTVGVILDEALPYYTGAFEQLPTSVNEPPTLPASTSITGQRFYLDQTGEPALCRHLQLKVQWPAEDEPNELLGLTLFGGYMQEQ